MVAYIVNEIIPKTESWTSSFSMSNSTPFSSILISLGTLFLTGIIALIIAVYLGRFRHLCRIMDAKMPYNIPIIWRKTWFRVASWIIVTTTSIWFAGVASSFTQILINKWLGRLLFGVLLVARWQLSGIMAATKAEKMIPGIITNPYYPLTKEDIERAEKELDELEEEEWDEIEEIDE